MKRQALKALALAIDVGGPLVATMTQFPLWIERSAEATVSGLFLFFAILSAVPAYKAARRMLKSPSAPIMWLILFVFLIALQAIISEMVIITFVGLVSNTIGFVLFKIATPREEIKINQ